LANRPAGLSQIEWRLGWDGATTEIEREHREKIKLPSPG
jgi:hypothetical protein